MKKLIVTMAAVIATIGGAEEASARAVISTSVNLYAGPAVDYPTVVYLRRNEPVVVYGCVDGWEWCDVGSGSYRGWVRGDYIRTWYHNRPVTFVEAAPRMNVPVIGFNMGYWDTHYRDRPFYRDRGRWDHHDNGWHRGHDRDRDDDHDNDRGHGRWHR